MILRAVYVALEAFYEAIAMDDLVNSKYVVFVHTAEEQHILLFSRPLCDFRIRGLPVRRSLSLNAGVCSTRLPAIRTITEPRYRELPFLTTLQEKNCH